jgi:hypothetical protein
VPFVFLNLRGFPALTESSIHSAPCCAKPGNPAAAFDTGESGAVKIAGLVQTLDQIMTASSIAQAPDQDACVQQVGRRHLQDKEQRDLQTSHAAAPQQRVRKDDEFQVDHGPLPSPLP